MLIQYFLLAGVWIIYCVIHSLLIATPVTLWIQGNYPVVHRSYRIIFNLFSIITLIPVVLYSISLRTLIVFRWDGSLRFLQVLFILIAVILVFTGAARYDLKQLLGLSQFQEGKVCQSISSNCELNSSGVLGLVRHPWYTAVIILLWARDLDPAGIVISTILTIYIIIGTFLEERKMLIEFGAPYREYQKSVSMFVPIKWLQSKIDVKMM